MTKADRIRALLILGLQTAAIARLTGCPKSYVRMVRSRTGPDGRSTRSNADWNHYPKRLQRQKRRYWDRKAEAA